MSAKTDILTTLTYFDIFQYPLTQTEIYLFLGRQHGQEYFSTALKQLIAEKYVFQLDEFYSLQNNYDLVTRRRKGNLAAKKLLDTAEVLAGFLSAFPFVRGVAISGSLSKNYADEKSDIDFFIITAKNRLWLARTAMHLFKKFTFLLRKQHLFCMNYFVDEAGLQIKEKNIYTATELATLLPLRGIEAFQDFYKHNAWSHQLLPNHSMKIAYTKEAKTPIVKRVLECCFNNILGNWLDHLFMKITANRWAKKTRQKKVNANGHIMGMDVNKHFAKPDPLSFQMKFLEIYRSHVNVALKKYEQRLKPVC